MTSSLKQLIESGSLPPEDESKVLHTLVAGDPGWVPVFCQLLLNQRRALRGELSRAAQAIAECEARIEKLRAPPWYPGTVLRVLSEGRVDLVSGGRRQVVATAPEIEASALQPGDEVLLNSESVVVERSEMGGRAGAVGTVSETSPEAVLLRGPGDEELRATCPPELAAALRPGDRVVYTREFPYVFERLPERTQSRWILDRPRPIPFESIGGLEALVAEIRRDLDLHLVHAERARAYRLRLLRGLLLVGPPGVGKTMLAGAVAHHLARTHPETRFLHVPPGAIRGIYYGESEARLRELFALARSAPELVVVFLDELDSYGARGIGIGQEIDGRVLGALLAEIDGLGSAANVLCIGATNRLDLCDPALVRQGRFGDRIYHVPRPDRRATRAILSTCLTADLPFAEASGEGAAAALIEAAVSYLHAPSGGAGTVATATLRNGERHEIAPATVLSGALLAAALERAKHAAAHRHLDGEGGLALEDVLEALDEALTAEARKLAAPHVASRMLDTPWADEIALVELPEGRRIRRHRHLRAA